MVRETPEIYERVVEPYIASFPPSRTKWVDEIISGKTESDKVLHRDDSGPIGYLIIPDMKWDLETVSSLYLMALATTGGVKSLRDLRKSHIPSLKSIIKEGNRVVQEKWGLREGSLRFYIHYQPSYCELATMSFAIKSNGNSRSLSCTHRACWLADGNGHVSWPGALG